MTANTDVSMPGAGGGARAESVRNSSAGASGCLSSDL